LACVKIGDARDASWKYIDKTGKVVIDKDFAFPSDFKNDMAFVKIGGLRDGSSAFIDKKGNFIWQGTK
jgi:hypothetical protein